MVVRFSHMILGLLLLAACSKSSDNSPNNPPDPPDVDSMTVSYGDSVLYVSQNPGDKIVLPLGNLKGRFYGFPEGIELDEFTGAINVNKSETGLRYRISFVADGSRDTISTIVLLSGVSYLDHIYHLDRDDTLALPVYNGRTENRFPAEGTLFDEGGGCNGEGISVDIADGHINLASTVRNGVFGAVPSNGAQKEVELLYRINDDSKKGLNKLKVKLYYFDTPEDIDADLVAEMNERRNMFIGLNEQPPFLSYTLPPAGRSVSSNSSLGTAKPRPPCIFLVGRLNKG